MLTPVFTLENVTQYNRNVNLPQVNVSRVNKALGLSTEKYTFEPVLKLYQLITP